MHIFLCIKASVRKSFCSLKIVLGKVSKFKKKTVFKNFCVQSVFTSFSVSNVFGIETKTCVKIVLCKGFSVEKFLCVKKCKKTPMCLYLCAQKHLCTKHLYVNTSFFA